MVVNTFSMCTSSQSSFVSCDGEAVLLIDHVLFPIECIDLIHLCHILNDDCMHVSSHCPIVVVLTVHVEKIHQNGLHFDQLAKKNK